jgi:cytochrome b561
MTSATARDRYDPLAQLLHWVVVALIVVQFVLANRAEDLPTGLAKLAVLAQHKSFGITILTLAFIRLAWRFASPPPPLPAGMRPLQRVAAQVSHAALYFLLFAMPVSGWAMSSAANYPVSWFGMVQLPDFVAPSEALHEALEELHEAMSKILLTLALLHTAAAVKHHFIDKDGLLWRMVPWRGKRQ